MQRPVPTNQTTNNTLPPNYQVSQQQIGAPRRPDEVIVDRRLDANSARVLARKVFSKYDVNGSGFLNSQESARLISELYASLNADHPGDNQEGLDLMTANDVNNDNMFSLGDFEEIFVRHLSTGDHTGYRLFYETPTQTIDNRFVQTGPTGTVVHREVIHPDPRYTTTVNRGETVVARPTMGGTKYIPYNKQSGEDPVTQVFRKYDRNGDGTVDVQELRNMYAELGMTSMNENTVQAQMAFYDQNKDGKITLDEWRSRVHVSQN